MVNRERKERSMHIHTMTFDSIQNKRIAIDWIRENIEPDDLDECLTEKKLAFLTGVELRKHQTARMQKEIAPTTYKVNEL